MKGAHSIWRRKFIAHLETSRPYTTFYIGLVALSAATLWQGQFLPLSVALCIFIGATSGWLASLYCCDYFDRDLDKLQKGHRPLPSGRMTEREALICMIVFLYLCCLASAWLSFTNLLLTGTALSAVFGYTITKAHTFLGNISRGIPCGIAVLAGIVASERGTIAHPQHLLFLILLPLLFVLHDATTNLIGTIRDIEGDRAGKCITLPVKYGLRTAIITGIGLTMCWELLAGLLPALLPMHIWDFYSFYGVALILSVIAFVVLIYQPDDRANALLSHKLFVAERVLLAGALLAGAVGIVSALAVVLPLLTLTLLSQKMMRDRYEFAMVVPT